MNHNFAKFFNTALLFLLIFTTLNSVVSFVENIITDIYFEQELLGMFSFSPFFAFIFGVLVMYLLRHKIYSQEYLELFYPTKKKLLSLLAFSIIYYVLIVIGEIVEFLFIIINYLEFIMSLGSYSIIIPFFTLYVIVCFLNKNFKNI